MRVAIVVTACLLALLAGVVLAIRHLVVDVPAAAASRAGQGAAEVARSVSEAVVEAFQVRPRIVVKGETIIHQDSEALKLVTIERPITERHRWDHSWLGSTKTFEIEGDFLARAGFDLTKPFVIDFDPDTNRLHAWLPPPEILSVDLVNLRILTDEDGLWNKLTPGDREQALSALREHAARDAAESDLTQRARDAARKRLDSILSTGGREVIFDPAPD